jgi:hydrogenase nickel incorporation protein HypA/HybF
MHEMGIASSILEAVRKELHRYPGCRASKVGVRIGEFAGVNGESLRFCFEAIVKGSPAEPLELGIEEGVGDQLDLGWLELDEEAKG